MLLRPSQRRVAERVLHRHVQHRRPKVGKRRPCPPPEPKREAVLAPYGQWHGWHSNEHAGVAQYRRAAPTWAEHEHLVAAPQ